MNYFEHPFVSNSDLGYFGDNMHLKPQKDLSRVYNFGTLLDAAITERHKLVHQEKKVIDETRCLIFDDEEWDKAMQMRAAGEADPFLSKMIKCCNLQAEHYEKNFEIEHEGVVFVLSAKCKLDFENPKISLGGDLKSTACSTQESFIQAICQFDYDRQGAWYMDIAKLQQYIIVGIGKNKKFGKYPIFKFAFNRASEIYLQGKRKYQYLAYHYKHKIANLYVDPI